MFLLNHVFYNIKCNNIRYVLFGIIIIFLSAFSIITLSSYDLAYKNIEHIKNDFGSVFTIGRSDNKVMAKDEILKLSKLKDISNISIKRYIYQIDIQNLYINNILYTHNYPIYNAFLSGYNKNNIDEYKIFIDNLNVVNGRIFQANDECVISKKFIDEVGDDLFISIGDKLKIKSPLENKEKEFIITGFVDDENIIGSSINNNKLFIYTTLEDAEYFKNDNVIIYTNGKYTFYEGYDVLYYITSYKEALSFINNVFKFNKENSDYSYLASYAKEGYNDLIKPLEKAQTAYMLYLRIIIIIGVIIIIIMTIINLMERRYDIGVLRCIGMSKARIISLFTLETLLFVLAVILTGLLIGSLLSGFFTDGLSADDYRADSFAILIETSAKVLLAGLALSFFSSLMSAVFILRYQPMKILRNRN